PGKETSVETSVNQRRAPNEEGKSIGRVPGDAYARSCAQPNTGGRGGEQGGGRGTYPETAQSGRKSREQARRGYRGRRISGGCRPHQRFRRLDQGAGSDPPCMGTDVRDRLEG